MIFVIIAALIVFGWCWHDLNSGYRKEKWWYKIGASLCCAGIAAFVTAFVVVIVCGLFFTCTEDNAHSPHHPWYRADIVSVKDSSSTHGEISGFLVVEGYVNSELDYTYYAKTGDGGLVQESVEADAVTVYQTNKVSPHLSCFISDDRGSFWTTLVKSHAFTGMYDFECNLYVPPGTIKETFSLGGS